MIESIPLANTPGMPQPVCPTKEDKSPPSVRQTSTSVCYRIESISFWNPGSKDDFIMADAAIKIVQQGGRLIGDDGGFDVIARKGANRGQRIPIGDHEDFDSVRYFSPEQCSALVYVT